MERSERLGKDRAVRRIRAWLGSCAFIDFRHQSLPSVRTSAGLAISPGENPDQDALFNAVALPNRTPSALLGFLACVLEYADNDRHSLFFAFATTVYILTAIQLEERDLIREHP